MSTYTEEQIQLIAWLELRIDRAQFHLTNAIKKANRMKIPDHAALAAVKQNHDELTDLRTDYHAARDNKKISIITQTKYETWQTKESVRKSLRQSL